MGKKKPKHQIEPLGNKKPKSGGNPDLYLNKTPSWCFTRCDKEHAKWRFCSEQFDEEIMDKLISYGNMKWQEIQSASGGKKAGNGTNSHFIPVGDLSKDAQKRLEELHIQVDELFSLRLTGKRRLFGLVEQGVFKIIWLDNNHEICKSNK